MRPCLLLCAIAALALPAAAPAAAPPDGGTVALQPRSASGDYDPALQPVADAVAAALARKGFTPLDDPNHAAVVADLVLGREEVGTGLARVAGQRTPEMAGMGVAVPLGTGRSDVVPIQRTRLVLTLHRRGDPTVFWRGAAVTVRATNGGKGSLAAVAADLSAALVAPYPAQAPGEVGVP